MKDKHKTKDKLINENELVEILELAETQRKRTEKALREGKEFSSSLLSNSPILY